MTPDDILKMQPGPEMDALVATQVMGWRHFEKSVFWMPNMGEGMLRYCNKSTDVPEFAVLYSFFRPSTNIADAMEVVEKMREKDCVLLDLSYTHVPHPNCRVRIGVKEYSEMNGIEATAESLPLAICRSALLATLP